jgi:hypothetical protein
MQERMPKDNREDLEEVEIVSFVNGSSSERWLPQSRGGRESEVVALCVDCKRALNLATHDGQCFTVGTIPQFPSPSPAPNPFSRKIPPNCRKNAAIALAWPASHTESSPPIFFEWS